MPVAEQQGCEQGEDEEEAADYGEPIQDAAKKDHVEEYQRRGHYEDGAEAKLDQLLAGQREAMEEIDVGHQQRRRQQQRRRRCE